ncbi:PREDICTED: coiled-coil domain-containing protein 115-like isoform X4 [Nelumbo nucifera]|uniref:Vacuolar ATPase assembly protein VMA22 n=1 Tax=Nelumbo nucifera TaxID=4432 RepID=A0A1U8B4U6_NELNU|nr:PREDICTED: coiled-coil domain-containing protein 115-like isoform X4 [Nelumbo nucifera]XP_010271146.1 PREDICTED: coiled-coil domain-containing protein 115-like isoform X4 [Nelumbo nucifera]XP_010271148.1 PREDICTED: coiled-coil domain-containing protein 115-like isoform X4 [Nelumbo nucifera]XP_019054972.1 PREDICTED: coiled-coil domain-containing protein 115-like isoform X4 [Nelumbo nucifera]
MEEQQNRQGSFENGREDGEAEHQQEESVVQFLDSMDDYLTLLDSLSLTLRQGWIDLASARHSMGLSRVTSALFDLKSHSAATTLHVSQQDGDSSLLTDAMVEQPHFVLYKWSSSDSGKCFSGEIEIDKQEMQQSSSSELRHRGSSLHSELQEEYSARSTPSPKVEDQVQKERFKSLSVFGTLVSPKLRAAQLSFETALETLIKIANMRSAMLSAFAQVQKHIEATTK